MPRGKKRTPRKASLSKETSEETSSSHDGEEKVVPVSQAGTEKYDSQEEKANVEVVSEEMVNAEVISEDLAEKSDLSQQEAVDISVEEEAAEELELLEDIIDQDEIGAQEEEEEVQEGGEVQEESTKSKEVASGKTKIEPVVQEKSIEDMPVTPYMPHNIPAFLDCKCAEKWEWHMRIYPIDQSDIRRCILDSVSKIAQETWFYIDKNNYGMGSYDLCMRSFTDSAMVMLKTLRAPMMYRYVTVEVTKRGKDPSEVEKIKQSKSTASGEEASDNSIEEAIEKLPYTEVLETATLHLDYVHTVECDKIKGKAKKRSLYVKYLPECTSKELLKVLFPVAISTDFISTESGRRVCDLDVSTDENLRAVLQTYVTVHINGNKRIVLGWEKENLDDGKDAPIADQESPWEVLPRDVEISYEATPQMEEDETIQYRKRKRDMDSLHRRGFDGQMRRNAPRGDKRQSRWDTEGGQGGPGMPPPAGMLQMQMAMNAKIQSQLALLHSVGDGPPPRGGPPMMGPRPNMPMGPMDAAIMRDRKRDRFERDRIDMEMAARRVPRDFPPFGMNRRPGRMGPPEGERRMGPDFMPPRERERIFEGNRGRGGVPFGGFGGRGGRFDAGEPERPWGFEGRFGGAGGGGDGRGRGFDFKSRGGHFDGPGRGGRGGRFDNPGRERFDSKGPGAGRGSDLPSRGGGEPAFGRGRINREGSSDQGRPGDRGNISSISPKVGRGFSQPKESGSVERIQSRDSNQRSMGRGAQKNKPVTHGFPSSFEKPTDSHRTLTQVTISNDNQSSSAGSGQQNNTQRQGSFGNRFGTTPNRPNNYNNQRSNSAGNRQFGAGSFQNRSRESGSQNQQSRNFGKQPTQQPSNFGKPPNQQPSNFGKTMTQQPSSFGKTMTQQPSNFGKPSNQQPSNFGKPNQQSSNFAKQLNQQSNFGSSQNRQGSFGQNRQNNFGSSQNQQQNFNQSQNQQRSSGAPQSSQTGYGTAGFQQSSYSSTGNQQSSYGAIGSQGTNYGFSGNQPNTYSSSGNQQTSFGNTSNQQSLFGSSQNQQPSYGSNQPSSYSNPQSSYGATQSTVSAQQSSYGSLQPQNYGNQQTYGSQQSQSAYGGYSTQQQQQGYNSAQQQQGYNSAQQQQGYNSAQQQQGYNSAQQQQGYNSAQQQQGYNSAQQQQGYNSSQQQQPQNYGASQSYDAQQQQQQQQSYGSQNYGLQQQQGYSSTSTYDWTQQASTTAIGGAASAVSNYSQNSYSGQQTQQQDYSAYSQQGQAAYPGYGSATSVPSTATGYGADSAFANQGLYSAAQGATLPDTYGSYASQDTYGSTNQQSVLGNYNYAQYQGST